MDPAFLEYCYSIITIGLVWFTLSYSLKTNTPLKRVFCAWFLFGLVFGMFAFLLPYTAYPIPWLAPGVVQMIGLFLFNFIVGLVCAVSYSLVTSFFYIKEKINISWWIKVLLFASLLSLAEVLRSILLSLLFYGNGGWIGLHWTGETIGNALSVTPFIEYAYFGGSYILTFIVGIFIYTVALLFKEKRTYIYYTPFVVTTFVLVLIHYTIPVRGPEKPVTLAVISTTFTFPSKGEDVSMTLAKHFVQLFLKTLELTPYKPDIIVYPEDAEFTRLLIEGRDEEIQKKLPDTLLVDGSTVEKNKTFSNVSVFYDTKTSTSTYAYKRFMFPLNEYIPHVFVSIFHYFINPNILDSFTKDHGYAPVFTPRSYLHNGIRVATLLCSEIVSFETVRAVGKEKPDIIFHQAQLILFRGSPIYTAHLRSFTKVAAAQLRTTTIGSINEMPSYIVSPHGRIVGEVYSNNKNDVTSGIYVVSKDGITPIKTTP